MRIIHGILLATCFTTLFITSAMADIVHGYSNVFSIVTTTAIEEHSDTMRMMSIVSVYPNPSNPRVAVEYRLAEAGTVWLAIYDLQGRLVRELAQETRSAGLHRADWDGLDAAGRAVSTGRYLCRLVFSGVAETRVITLIR